MFAIQLKGHWVLAELTGVAGATSTARSEELTSPLSRAEQQAPTRRQDQDRKT
ncbi:hypothetical protein PCASD_09402 [Puccinia coronata f. sp. avenae]|uniref:Uncharacterized protein n=1 Tax=Puccinia coronata f. sp. avenae TaxID=200324 RepID=A0A2N5V1F7_9BASI|nr:hypothetical protein PCASD_09402 [Puccinia coronata f. sp. avenae]